MDELLIKYCKENGYIYIDYSNKFIEYNDDTIKKMEDLMNKKRLDDKYAKVVFRINFEKINKKFVKILKIFLDNRLLNNKSLFITKFALCSYTNSISLNNYNVKYLFTNINEQTCCICLEGFKNKRVACFHCSAEYHFECIEDDKYPYVDDDKIFCCICKNQM